MSERTKLLVRGLCLSGLLSVASACDRYGTYCADKVDCEDGSDADVEACIVQQEEAEERASLWDCDEWYDLWFECAETGYDCDNKVWADHDDKCGDESDDKNACGH